ncbi:MAG: nucleotidyltransferase domain-containing protein [Nitrospirae bacterium]|nr:MAG: nucleotidyltransferase domain-containing protein [Nitrospirota bacterium]
MGDGLRPEVRRRILEVVTANPRVERVVLFGSRATGEHRAGSDVDLALFGSALTLDDQSHLAAALEALTIAQRVDLVRFDALQDEGLREHILREGVEWYRRGQGRGGPSLRDP